MSVADETSAVRQGTAAHYREWAAARAAARRATSNTITSITTIQTGATPMTTETPKPTAAKPATATAKKAARHAEKAADTKAKSDVVGQAADDAADKVDIEVGRARSRQLYSVAVQNKAVGQRGKGRKMTDDELADYCRNVLAVRPGAYRNQEQEVAYWVEGIALTGARFKAAWAAAGGSDEKAPRVAHKPAAPAEPKARKAVAAKVTDIGARKAAHQAHKARAQQA